MPTHKTLEEYQRARDTATYPHWYFHHCCECNWFSWEYRYGKESPRKNFCVKWNKRVNPDQWARSCFVFRPAKGTKPTLLCYARNEQIETRAFTWKKGICKWHGQEFYYKQYRSNDIRRYCSDYCRWQFKHFVRKIKKNSQLMRPYPQVNSTEKEQSLQQGKYYFSSFWGAQSATGTKSSIYVKTPIWISYSVGRTFFARYCSLFVTFYFLE